MTKRQENQGQRGYSILEVLTVVLLIGILSAIAVPLTQTTTMNYRANSAMTQVVSALREARELAISKRRNVQINFLTPNQIQTTVFYLPGEVAGNAIPTIYLNDADMVNPPYSSFTQFPGVPDTPMGFCGGTCSSPINLQQPNGAGSWTVMFTASGELVGTTQTSGFATVGNNNPVDATLFIGIPTRTYTARAVTVFGATGRVRTYYWTGTTWQE